MSNNELISIVIPIYNVENYVEKCLNSVIRQTYNNIEIILIDDGSKDKSKEICDSYARKDKRINVIHKENRGVSSARNTGIEAAKGNYITFIDSDDYIDEDYIEKLYGLCIKNNSDIVICGVKDEDCDGNIVKQSKEIKVNLNKKDFLKELLNQQYFFTVCWAKFYKRDIIGNIRFNENMKIAEDFDFLYRLLDNVHNVYVDTTEKMYHFLMREGSATKSGFNADWQKEIELCQKIVDDVSSKWTDLEKYAIKRYFNAVMSCMIMVLKSNSEKNDIKYLREKLKKYKEKIKKNTLISKKQKIFFYIVMINPYILGIIFNIKKKIVK